MGIGTSIFLIAVGAILKYAVTASVSGVDLNTVGVILMVVGVVGLLLSLLWMTIWADRRRTLGMNCASYQARNVRLANWNDGPDNSGGERSVSMRAVVAHGPSKPSGARSNTPSKIMCASAMVVPSGLPMTLVK